MKSWVTTLGLAAALTAGLAGSANAAPVMYYTNSDGADFVLDVSNVGNLYTFDFTADFTGVTTSNALGDYAMLISFKSSGSSGFGWSEGSILAAPGTDANWDILQDDSNSNGCKAGTDLQQFCLELLHDPALLTGPVIQTGTVLNWQWTMTLATGTPNFATNWPFKFTTTTGAYDTRHDEWTYGGYQISQELRPCTPTNPLCDEEEEFPPVPEPGTFLLLGSGLAAAVARRKMKNAQ